MCNKLNINFGQETENQNPYFKKSSKKNQIYSFQNQSLFVWRDAGQIPAVAFLLPPADQSEAEHCSLSSIDLRITSERDFLLRKLYFSEI